MVTLMTSLSASFRLVPPEAIPPMLDCILASNNLSPSSLFSSILNDFPNLTKEIMEGNEKLNSEQRNYALSYVGALCHLLKKSGDHVAALQSLIWEVLIPLMKLNHAYNLEILNQATRLFYDVISETDSWGVVEKTIVPFFLRLIGLSMGMLQSEKMALYAWTACPAAHDLDDQPTDGQFSQCSSNSQLTDLTMANDFMFSESGPFLLSMSCQMLTSMLVSALKSKHSTGTTYGLTLSNGSCVKNIAGNLLWDLCNITPRMLLQSREHRSSAISFLLPFIFRAFASEHVFEVLVHGQMHRLYRKHFLNELWKCCRALFSLGSVERRDAYTVLSLYLSFFSCTNGFEDVSVDGGEEEFDLRHEKEFWDETKRGLVDKEGLVRKQSLHILKTTVWLSDESQSYISDSGSIPDRKTSSSTGLTKRGRWAEKEAQSLGVGRIYKSNNLSSNNELKWGAFFLLYEMLEEYGTHLVEAAWNHQVTLLLNSSVIFDNSINSNCGGIYSDQMGTLVGIFKWLEVLWDRGFCHDNPQVRFLIMQSFLGIEWKNYGNCSELVPEGFVLGPFLHGLNDPVHHKDFGLKGVYTSKTIAGATNFLSQYTSSLDKRKQITFLSILASCAKKHSFGRAGLMALVECIASAACGFQMHQCSEVECCKDVLEEVNLESASESCYQKDKVDFLDILRFIIESSKQHFNRSYRHQVCEKIVDAAVLVISALEMPLEILLYFISAIPREFSNCSGSLKAKLQEWLSHSDQRHSTCHGCTNKGKLLVSLSDFPKTFITCHKSVNSFASYDDEDVDAWASEASRWARVIFLVIKEEHLDPILMFIQTHGVDICKQRSLLEWEPVKFLILILSLLQEIQLLQERTSKCRMRRITKSDLTFQENHLCSDEFSIVFDKFYKSYLSILEELVSFTNLSCYIFWSNVPLEDKVLPSSIRGKLGGPSQRRLSSTATTTVLKAITSMRTVTSISCWCTKFRSDVSLYSAVTSLWKLSLKMISSPVFDSEIEAEICLAAFEALAYALNALVDVFSPLALNIIIENDKSLSDRTVGKSLLDSFVLTFIHKVSDLVAVGKLVRTRRAILMNWKWICIEALLSIPKHDLENGVHIDGSSSFFSDSTIRWIFGDLVDGLENAGEGSILPMLRSIRLIFELFALGKMVSVDSSWHGVDLQMMWKLVQSAWVLHVSCNKRRVAPIAALLSSVLHNSVFSDEDMHQSDNASGPLKWFTEKILEEGTRSPRTIRLAALHLTGLWLANPNIIKYYMKELKLLTMYGSVAFDEDFKGELTDNHDAKCEVSVLAKSPDPELTEEFINTELYARVSVAVLFYEMSSLADTLGSGGDNKASERHESGKMFLLELLYSVVNDKDLSKELYKKYSAIHRRKIRAWQMICILAHFVDQDIIQEVTHSLYTSLHRNNLPSVRQYMETFLIHIYLKFPWLVGEQLVPLLRNYDMRPQALSSYVFVAANIILHSTDGVQLKHLDDLFPPIISLLTSHHHTLRGFTQLLVYQVLQKLLPTQDHGIFKMLSLEKRCLEDLKSYLSDNSDCARLRASMEGYLDAFDPKISITPAGIFYNRVENVEFECVPTSLMDRLIFFLNDTREDLRSLMAKDAVTLKNERMQTDEDTKCRGTSGVENEVELSTHLPVDISLDFQKKFTLSKKDGRGIGSTPFLGSENIFESLLDMEKEDQLIELLLHSRTVALEELRASRQHFILVASFLDRIPNLAGLARTCEVFKAAALAIADKSILHDKQFQLISVTAERWVPTVEVPVNNVKIFLEKMKREGFSILGLEQTANSVPLDQYNFPEKTVMVLGREKEGIPVEIIHILDVCIEIPQLGVVRSLNVHVSGAIALWEYTRQQRSHQLRY